MYSGKYVTVGFSVKPPMKISRSFSGQVMVDTNGIPSITKDEWKDNIELPWRGTVGLSLAVRENLRLGFEYEIRSYASAVYNSTVTD